MSKGYIKVHRAVMDNEFLYRDKPFNRFAAWIDLLMLAQYEDNEYNGRQRKRGEVHRSYSNLADRWGWSINRTRRFISELAEKGMVTINGTFRGIKGGIIITVENYGVYQGSGIKDGIKNESKDGIQLNKKKENKKRADVPKSPSRSLEKKKRPKYPIGEVIPIDSI